MKYIFLPYEEVKGSYPQFARRLLSKDKNTFSPVVWCAKLDYKYRINQWYYAGWKFVPKSKGKTNECNSKEDGMKKLDEELIANGCILIDLWDRAEKLKLLL